jgi:hypothetical protein
MKSRVMSRYVEHLGITEYDSYMGLRADEPARVFRLRDRDTHAKLFRTPLHDAGITKADVMEFWKGQKFDLQIEDHQGNCTGCFLKDQSDLSRVLGEAASEARWWFDIEDRYQHFGGRGFAGYRTLAAERPARLNIETALRSGHEPVNDGTLDPRRFKLVVRQEKVRLDGSTPSFSCSCEQSIALAETDTDHLVGAI